jgi:hypothetical protein
MARDRVDAHRHGAESSSETGPAKGLPMPYDAPRSWIRFVALRSPTIAGFAIRLGRSHSVLRSFRRSASSTRRILAFACVAFATIEALGIGLFYARERARLHTHMNDASLKEFREDAQLVFVAPGIDRPATREARAARLADDEPILGVNVGGHPRAYRVLAMQEKTDHIVNDVIGGRPVTVTYCNLYDRARAFTGKPTGSPLPIAQGGLCTDGMIIRVGDSAYSQKSLESASPRVAAPPFPFSPLPLERTTWKEWRTRYPETDVFEGVDPGDVGTPR